MIPVKLTGMLRKGVRSPIPVHCKKCGKMLKQSKGGASLLEICGKCLRK